MINIVNKLHELETQLERLRENKGEGPLYSLKKLVNVEELEEWLEEDLNIIENVLGKEFIKRTTRHAIDNQKIIEIENKMISLLSEHEYNILIPFIRRLRYKTVKELLRQYPDYIQNLAVHLNKQVNWVLVEGSDIELDSEKCHDFIKSLIHVFRNMVDHGIETINQRVAKGKEEFGSIKCRVNYQEEYIVISISDDGGGISIEDLKKNIMEKGLLDSEKVNSISKEELINYIFQEGFSTQKDISVISGRGVGLSFVKHEVERLGGFVKVNTEVDKGTEFLFFLPNVANLHYTDNA
jgi:two-component system chemotaxis sensor kinase CheA